MDQVTCILILYHPWYDFGAGISQQCSRSLGAIPQSYIVQLCQSDKCQQYSGVRKHQRQYGGALVVDMGSAFCAIIFMIHLV